MFRIIATDFCCWFPISVMALLSVGGIPISNTVYAVSAIILLPINSSINPIVYSSAIDRIFQKFKKSEALNKCTSSRMWHLNRFFCFTSPKRFYIFWIVIIVETNKLRPQNQESTSVVKRNNQMLLVNLAVADLIMGVYLLMLGGAGVVYRRNFCAYRLTWLSSSTCSVMGVMVLLSSETCVIILIFLISARLYGVLKVSNLLLL